MVINYNMTLTSKEFGLIKNILKHSGSAKAMALADDLETRQKDMFKAIAKDFQIELKAEEAE